MKPMEHVECSSLKLKLKRAVFQRGSQHWKLSPARLTGSRRLVLDSCLGTLGSLLQGGWVAPAMLVATEDNFRITACTQTALSDHRMPSAVQLELTM